MTVICAIVVGVVRQLGKITTSSSAFSQSVRVLDSRPEQSGTVQAHGIPVLGASGVRVERILHLPVR